MSEEDNERTLNQLVVGKRYSFSSNYTNDMGGISVSKATCVEVRLGAGESIFRDGDVEIKIEVGSPEMYPTYFYEEE